MDIKLFLKQRRKELHLTMKDVANMVGVSESTISRWESGAIANMTRANISELAKALQISPSIIMGWQEDKKTEPTAENGNKLSQGHIYLMDFVKTVPEDKIDLLLKLMRTIVEDD